MALSYPEPYVNFTVYMPTRLLRALRERAADDGVKVSPSIVTLLEAAVAAEPTKAER